MSGPVPTRWLTQMEQQLDDAARRLAGAGRQLDAGDGGRALEEVYPGVMGAAMVMVWIAEGAWRNQRSLEDLSHLVRERLPSGFATLFEMKAGQRNFSGWRAEDARPLVEEARAFVTSASAEFERCRTTSSG